MSSRSQKPPGEWRSGFTHLPIRYTLHLDERREDDALKLACDGVALEVPGGIVRDSLVRGLANNFERYEPSRPHRGDGIPGER